MKPSELDFSSEFKLTAGGGPVTAHALVLWFDVRFSKRFCVDKEVELSTSPYAPRTHWAQTVLALRCGGLTDADGDGFQSREVCLAGYGPMLAKLVQVVSSIGSTACNPPNPPLPHPLWCRHPIKLAPACVAPPGTSVALHGKISLARSVDRHRSIDIVLECWGVLADGSRSAESNVQLCRMAVSE